MPAKEKSAKISVSDDTPEAETVEVKTTEPTTAPELPAEAPVEPEEDSLDPETEQAVDDIAAQEADELLAAEDEQVAAAFEAKKPGRWQRFKNWWRNPIKRRLSLAAVAALLVAVFVLPVSRYFVLNTVGVRSAASLAVLDDSTQQPLKNVTVSLGGQTAQTDKAGKVTFRGLKLGKTHLSIHKRAFATYEQDITIGWGSNPLDNVALRPEGSQYTFIITDYLSGKPMTGVEAISDEASALSNEQGELTLTLEPNDEATSAQVSLTLDGYRTENRSFDLNSQEAIKIELVPARAHVFVSKRSGRYDVYKIDADGLNEEKILAGSGVERDDLVLVQHPSKSHAALVSTRENVRRNGFLLSTLTLIDTDAKTPTKVAQSERIQIVDWVGDRLVFVQVAAGASGDDPQRHRLMSYDLSSGQAKELAAANFFNDVLAVGNYVYYAPSAAYAENGAALYRIQADGSGKQTVLNEEVWNVYRTGYDKFVLATGQQEWHEYQIATNKTNRLPGEPGGLASRVYADNPDGKRSLWADERDGKGVLLAYEVEAKTEAILHERSGLTNPLNWLGSTAVVFRVATSDEIADYVMSLDGGEPKKLRDVTNTGGIERWYYY